MNTSSDIEVSPIYQAIGTVKGLINALDNGQFTITIGDHTYELSALKRVKVKFQLGTIQYLKVYPRFSPNKELFFSVLYVVKVEEVCKTAKKALAFEEGLNRFVLSGCWEIYKGKPFLMIYRNQSMIGRLTPDKDVVTPLEINWLNAPDPDGQFWQLGAELNQGHLVINKITGVSEAPPKIFTEAKASMIVPVKNNEEIASRKKGKKAKDPSLLISSR